MSQVIRITPDGSLLFRDARPFSAGVEAVTLPFPLPQTIAGAVRTTIGSASGYDFVDPSRKQDCVDEVMKWSVHGPLLELAGNRFYPAPADAHVTESTVLPMIPLEPGPGCGSNLPDGLLPMGAKGGNAGKPDASAPAFWPESLVVAWLTGGTVPHDLRVELKRHGFTPGIEPRTGIEVATISQCVKDAMLFGSQRLQVDAMSESDGYRRGSYIVKVDAAPDLRSSCLGRVGGESGIARFSAIEASSWPAMPQELIKAVGSTKNLKMQLVTPAIFGAGFHPAAIPGLSLVGACVPRWIPVAGWDYANRQPKPLRRMAPAGSVYFFKADSPEVAVKIARDNWIRPMSDERTDQMAGFGLAAWGVW